MKYFVLSVALLLPITTMAAPGIPHQLYGQVQSFTEGTLRAIIDGSTVGSISLTDEGKFGYDPFFFVEDEEGVFAGETISFTINNEEIEQTVVFANGGFTQLSLSKKSTGSGTGGNELPTTSSGPVSVSVPTTNPFDPNGDGIVDISDFNYFMANWGSAETDFNGDGVVDVKDFNILMSNWS